MHNILVTGGVHIDRIKYANELALQLLCLGPQPESACGVCRHCQRASTHTHPNIIFIEPSISEHSEGFSSFESETAADVAGFIRIDQIRRIIVENQKANFEKGVGIFIITHMHKATKSAANALLKVMEESHPNKVFIALAPSRKAVLPTIASRLVCRFVKPSPISLPTADDEKYVKIMSISKMKPSDRINYCTRFSSDRDELITEINALSHTCHAMLRDRDITPFMAKQLLEALINAEDRLKKNLNTRLVMEVLILREWPFMTM